jgi:hypothetical protein
MRDVPNVLARPYTHFGMSAAGWVRVPRRRGADRSQAGAPGSGPKGRPGLPPGPCDPLGFGMEAAMLQWPGVTGQEIV